MSTSRSQDSQNWGDKVFKGLPVRADEAGLFVRFLDDGFDGLAAGAVKAFNGFKDVLGPPLVYLQIKAICEPERIDEWTGRRFTFFRDPDGLPLEIYEETSNLG